MAEKLGLEAVFDTAGFSQAIATYNSGLQNAVSRTNEAGHAMGGIGDKLKGLGGAFQVALGNLASSAITGALGLISQGISGITSSMIGGNAEFERYQTQFGVLLGSADAAKQRLDELAKFGATTPFELPEVVRADKILQAFGLHSEEAAKRFGFSGTQIRTIAGDVAAGTGASFEEISGYLGKFASGATGEAIARMQELGIVTRKELTGMGVEFDKSGALVSPLDDAMGIMLKAMQDKFGGMMDAQSQTFEGMISNLQDWLGQTGRILGKPIFDVLKNSLGNLLKFLGSDVVKNGITGFANSMAAGLQRAIDSISAIIARLQPIIEGVIGVFGRWGDVVTKAGGNIRALFTVFEDGSTYIGSFFEALGMGEETANIFGEAIARAGAIVIDFFTFLRGGDIQPFYDGLKAVVGLPAATFISDLTIALRLLGDVVKSGSLEGLTAFLQDVGFETAGLDTATLAVGNFLHTVSLIPERIAEQEGNIGQSVSVIVGGIAEAFGMGQTEANKFSDQLIKPINRIIAGLKTVTDWLAANWGTIFETAMSLAGMVITRFVTNLETGLNLAIQVFEAVFNGIAPIVENVVATLQENAGQIGEVFAAIPELVISPIDRIGTVINALLPVVNVAFTGIGEVVGSVLSVLIENLDVFKTAFEGLGVVVQAVVFQVNSIINSLLPVVQSVFSIIAGVIENNGGAVLQNLGAAWTNVVNTVTPAVNAIGSIVRTVFDVIAQFLNEHGAEIEAFIGETWTAISEIIRVATELIQAIIVPIFEFIAKFVSDNQEGLKSAIEVVWGLIQVVIGTALDLIKGILTTAMALIKGDWEGAWNSIKGAVESIWNRITEFLSGIPALMLEKGRAMIQGFIDGINSMAQAVLNAVLNLLPPALRELAHQIGLGSPSRLMAWYGRMMMTGLAQGIERASGEVYTALDDVGDKMLARMSLRPNATFGVTGSLAGAGPLGRLDELIGLRLAAQAPQPVLAGAGGGQVVNIYQTFNGPATSAEVKTGTLEALRRAGIFVQN